MDANNLIHSKKISDRMNVLVQNFGDGKNTVFAAKIGDSEANIRNYRSGKTTPKYAVLVSIVKVFDVSAEWLLTGEGEMLRTDKPQPCAAPPPEPTAATADTIPLVDIIRRQAEEIGYLKARLAQFEGRNGAE